MTRADNDASRDDAASVGLALLLGGGVAEATEAVEATLATVRGAATQAFARLARVQAAGAAAAAVPAAPRPMVANAAPPEAPANREQTRPTKQFAPPPAARRAGAEQVAAVAPVSVPAGSGVAAFSAASTPAGGGVAAFSPAAIPGGGGVAAFARALVSSRGVATPEPVAAAPAAAEPSASPIPLAVFAPPAPAATGVEMRPAASGGEQFADTPSARADSSGWMPVAGEPASPMAAAAANAEPAHAHAPPATRAAQGGPTGGDVFLDGTLVGTWLADHMAREAGRPQTGSTGFDPRLTPAWPGTLQGS